MTVKRNRDFDDTEIERMAMANCLMLSSVRKSGSDSSSEPGRLFHCKTCNRPFKSFQALGGHRASHKRMKLNDFLGQWKVKSTHECSVCGMEFAIGQALGGHMRRHRDEGVGKGVQDVTLRMAPVKKEREIRGFCFDLNLMPYENELTLWPMVSG